MSSNYMYTALNARDTDKMFWLYSNDTYTSYVTLLFTRVRMFMIFNAVNVYAHAVYIHLLFQFTVSVNIKSP